MTINTTGERLAVVERRVEDLNEWARELKNAVENSATSNAAAIKELTLVVTELAGIKTDHERNSLEIESLRQRQHKLANDFGRVALLEVKFETIKADGLILKAFREDMMKSLPNIQLASGWVFKSILFILTGLGSVAMAVIIKGGVQ